MEKNAFEDWVVIKGFLDRLLGDRAHRVHISWLDWMQTKKSSNQSDDTFLQRFNILKTQIRDEANDPAKIEVMLFVGELDEPMQQKIHKQSSIPEKKHEMVAFAKKLRSNMDREPKPFLPTDTRLTSFSSAPPEQSNAPVASYLHEESGRKELFCSYCEKKSHK